MKTAYIFHDSFSDPVSEWYPWMKTTLESMGYVVNVPKFPTPAGQSYESWRIVLKNYIPTFDEETILIGHGTGGLLALRLVEESPKQLQGLFLIASYAEAIGNVGYDRINKTFYDHPFDWAKVTGNVRAAKVFAGAGDPFVSDEISRHLAEHLGTSVETIPDGGHLNKASGFVQLVPVAQGIKESLKSLDKSIEVETPDPVSVLPEYLFPKVPVEHEEETKDKTAKPPVAGEEAKPKEEMFAAHTMYEDMSHLVNSNQGKVASSLLTEARTQEAVKKAASPASPKNVMYMVATVISFLVIVGIGLYLAEQYAPAPQIVHAPAVVSLIQADDHQKIEVTPGQPFFMLEQSIQNALSQAVPDGTIRDLYYMSQGQRVSFANVLASLGVTDLPAGLNDEFTPVTSAEPVFMHGISQDGSVTTHFLVLRVNDYDTTFALLKQWEPTMFRDLGVFMNVSPDFLKTSLAKSVFDDELISNNSVRVLRYHAPATISLSDPSSSASSDSTATTVPDSQNAFVGVASPYQEGDIMLAYFFLDEHTLIITDNVNVIPELLKRWSNSQIYSSEQ